MFVRKAMEGNIRTLHSDLHATHIVYYIQQSVCTATIQHNRSSLHYITCNTVPNLLPYNTPSVADI